MLGHIIMVLEIGYKYIINIIIKLNPHDTPTQIYWFYRIYKYEYSSQEIIIFPQHNTKKFRRGGGI